MKAEELKRRRVALGLTQAQLGAEMDVSGNTISRWEIGEIEPEHSAMLDKALKWLELSKALKDDPWLEEAEGMLAQMETKLKARRKQIRKELVDSIARIEANPKRAARMADDLNAMKKDLAELS